MMNYRTFLLILCASYTLEMASADGNKRQLNFVDWMKENVKKDSFSFADAKALVRENIQMVSSKKGSKLQSFDVKEQGECALACGVFPNCHFIKIEKNKKTSLKKFKCTMYAEDGKGEEVKVDCTENQEDNIKEWVKNSDHTQITFLGRLLEYILESAVKNIFS